MHNRVLRWAANWRLWLALWALAVMAFPALTLVLAVSIIGLPIAILLMLIPGVALILLPAAALKDRVVQLTGPITAWAVSIGAIVLASALIANAVNAGLDLKAKALVADDFNRIKPEPIRKLALVSERSHRSRDEFACRSLCLRILLNGEADEVLIASGPNPFALGDDAPAVAARFEKRADCGRLRLPDGDDGVKGDEAQAPEIARRRIAAGDCLVERDATLKEADAIVAYGEADSGLNAFTAGLNVFADTVRAERLTFLRRRLSRMEEAYRWTGVVVERHPPLLFLTIIPGYAFEATAGFARPASRHGFSERFQIEADLGGFLSDTLGLRLALDENAAPRAADLVDALLNRTTGDFTPADLSLATDFFQGLSPLPRRDPSREDALRAVRLLERFDFELSYAAPSAIRRLSETFPEFNARIADAQFKRLFATAPDARDSHYNDPYIRRIATALSMLPDDALLPHRGDLWRLAGDEARRVRASALLARLPIFGADATDALLRLIDDALALRAADPDNDSGWDDLYRAGLSGLCTLGEPRGASALIARLEAEPALKRWPARELLINTLIASGESDERLRAILASPGAGEKSLSEFNRQIARARRKPECQF